MNLARSIVMIAFLRVFMAAGRSLGPFCAVCSFSFVASQFEKEWSLLAAGETRQQIHGNSDLKLFVHESKVYISRLRRKEDFGYRQKMSVRVFKAKLQCDASDSVHR